MDESAMDESASGECSVVTARPDRGTAGQGATRLLRSSDLALPLRLTYRLPVAHPPMPSNGPRTNERDSRWMNEEGPRFPGALLVADNQPSKA